jgi:hypothetical protein
MKRTKAPITTGITDCTYSIHIQADCYSYHDHSYGVAWPGFVNYIGTHFHLNSFHGFRAVTAVQ